VGFPDKGDPQILEQIIRAAFRRWLKRNAGVNRRPLDSNDDIHLVTPSLASFIRNEFGEMSARARRCVVLTKALGTGVISTALKRTVPRLPRCSSYRFDVGKLNRAASEALQEFRKCRNRLTDSCGDGCYGIRFARNGREMALGNPERGIASVSLEIDHSEIAYLPVR